jgi:hypothetical protein
MGKACNHDIVAGEQNCVYSRFSEAPSTASIDIEFTGKIADNSCEGKGA